MDGAAFDAALAFLVEAACCGALAFAAGALATDFFVVVFFTTVFFAGTAFLDAAVRTWFFAGADRFAAFAGVPVCFGAAAFEAAVRVAAFFPVAVGALRALVDLPVAFAIGRSLRSLALPRTGKAGDVTRS